MRFKSSLFCLSHAWLQAVAYVLKKNTFFEYIRTESVVVVFLPNRVSSVYGFHPQGICINAATVRGTVAAGEARSRENMLHERAYGSIFGRVVQTAVATSLWYSLWF